MSGCDPVVLPLAVTMGEPAGIGGEITLKAGRVQQSNFDNYQMLRMNEAPEVEVHIVQSQETPGGMGEAGKIGRAHV